MDTELIAWLLAFASSFSGLPAQAPEDLPPIVRLAPADLHQQVCPERPADCTGIAAYFDIPRYRILIDARLDLNQPADHSYLLHEFVHVLQFQRYGPGLFARCEDALRHEALAYRVQNAYLRRQGVLLRVGAALAAIARCNAEDDNEDRDHDRLTVERRALRGYGLN